MKSVLGFAALCHPDVLCACPVSRTPFLTMVGGVTIFWTAPPDEV